MERAEGIQEGREEGREVALRGALLQVLEARFGSPGAELRQDLECQHDPAKLEVLVALAARAEDLESFRRNMG